MKKIILLIIVIFLGTGQLISQTVAGGIFANQNVLRIKVKPSSSFSGTSLSNLTFSVRWLTSYGITISDMTNSFGILKDGTIQTSGSYSYQNYATVTPTAINWTANQEYDLGTITIDGGAGTGTFELSPTGFTAGGIGDWYVEIGGVNRTPSAGSEYYQSSVVANLYALGPANKLTIQTQPSSAATAGVAFSQQPVVRIEDSNGNLVVADNSTVITASRSKGTGILQGTVTATAVNGIATFTNLSYNIAETLTVAFTSSPILTPVTSNNVVVNAAALSNFLVESSSGGIISTQTAGIPFNIKITARDAYSNTVLSFTGSVNITSTGTLSSGGGTSEAFTSGVLASHSVTISNTGSFTITATKSAGSETGTSNAFTVNAGVPKQLVFVQQPTTGIAGAIISPSVTVQLKDSLGNNASVVGVSVTMTLSSGTGNLNGTTTKTTAANGIATFNDLSVDQSGSKVFTAISTGLTSAVSNSFTLGLLNITVQTNPASDSIIVDGVKYISSQLFSWVANSSHTIAVDSVQSKGVGIRHRWSSWSDGGLISHVVAPTRDSTYTANFTTQYYLTMNSNPGGSVTPTSNWYNSGQVVTITGIASAGYSFNRWTGVGTGSYSGINNPSSVTMSGPITETASFTQNNVQVTVQTVPVGRAFRVDGVDYTTTQTFSYAPGSQHRIGIYVDPQPGVTGTQYKWSSWSDGGLVAHDIFPVSDTVITASFSTQYYLTMNSGTGGTVSPASGWHNSGDTVAISASANSGLGYSFSGWSGSGTGSYTGPGNPVNIIMGGAITESGSFTQLPVHVTVQTTPAGDSIIVDGVKYISSQLFTWTSGSSHTIGLDSIQVINSGTRHVWNNWSDAKARSHTIVPLSDTTYTANLATQYYLTMIAGTGGTVSPSSGWYNSGQVVGISAASSSGYSFNSWTGTGTGSYSGVINPSSVTMSGAISESASFTQLPIQVTVQTNPVGRSFSVDDTLYTSAKTFVWMPGTSHTILTSSPQAGVSGTQYVWSSWSDGGLISHVVAPTRDSTYTANFTTQYYLTMNSNPGGSVTPTSNWYNSGQVVTITGIASAGYSFNRWTGVGTGSYSGINNPSSVTMSGPITETASFTQNNVQVTVQTVPVGRAFRVDGVDYTTTQTFSYAPGSQHRIGIYVDPQPGVTGTQYKWSSWSDGGLVAHDIFPVSDTVITASFSTQYYLTMNSGTGGTVSPASGWHNSGDTVAISASANSGLGYSFSGWSGSGTGSYTGPGNPVNIIMGGAITESGSFTQLPVHVTVQTTPAGDSIIVDGVKYISSQLFTWTSGSSHTIGLDSIQVINSGTRHVWNNWSDAKARSHTIVPLSDTTYTANLATQYYLTMIAGTGGTVSPSSGWYNSGQVVGISAASSSGYSFSSWTGTGTGSYSGVINPSSVTMSGAISESASFTQLPIQVTVQTNPVGRSFSVDDTLYTSAKTFVWMPGTSHTILTSSPQAGVSGTQYVWSSWSDGGLISHVVAPTRDSTYTANFTTQYYLTMNSNPGGSVTPTSNWYNSGQVVTITGIASAGYSFNRWTGVGTGSYSGINNPSSVTMSGPITETASFTQNNVQVTVQTVPVGRAFRVDGVDYTTTQTFSYAPGSQHRIGIYVDPQPGVTGTQYKWSSWSDGGLVAHDIFPVSDTVITASFSTQYYLTMNSGTGGTVSPASGWHNSGDTVAISASANSGLGYSFSGWSGSGTGSYTGPGNPVNIIMGGAITESGSFTQLPVHVTVQTTPAGDSIIVDGVKYISSQLFTWTSGSSHTIGLDSIQVINSGTRHVWNNWSDAKARSHTIVPLSDTTYTANLATQYYLTMIAGTGGTVSPSSGWYNSGQVVGISAASSSGYSFNSWTGTGTGSYSGVINPSSVTMSGAISESASFTQLPIQVTVQTNPVGRSFSVDDTLYTSAKTFVWMPGTSHTILTSSPQAGVSGTQYVWSSWSDGGLISHVVAPTRDSTYTANFTTQYYLTMNSNPGGSVTPTSNWYNSGQVVTITGIASAGYSFNRWTGVGTGSYSGINNPSSVTMSGPITETASFTQNNVQVTVQTVPVGRAFRVDGVDYTTTQTFSYAPGSQHRIGIYVDPQPGVTGTQYKWSSWSDGGLVAHDIFPVSDTVITASFSTQYYLTMNSGTGGTVSPASGWHNSGDTVAISASANSGLGYSFSGWSGSGTGSYTGPGNPVNIIMGGAITESGSFTQLPVHVTVQTTPAGDSIIVDGVKYISSQLFTWTSGSSHTIGLDSIQVINSGTRHVWNNWSDAKARSHTIVPLSDTTYTANLATQYYLTMIAGTGGTVSPSSGWYNSGQVVGISAASSSGYSFNSWTGTGTGSYSGVINPSSVTMSGAISESASFTQLPIQVTVQTNPVGRSFSVDDTLYTSAKTFVWMPGTSHTILTSSPQAGVSGTQYVWSSWSDGGLISHVVAPTRDSTYTANFTTQYYLTMNSNPGGSVTPTSNWYNSGQVVTITGIASAGYSFNRWTGVGTGSYSGINNPSSVTMSGPITETASFTQNNVQVTVQTVPVGRAFRVDGVDYTTTQTFSYAPGSQHRIGIYVDPQPGVTGTQYKWSSWSDGGLVAHDIFPVSDTVITASFSTQYYLTMNSGTGGTVSPASGWHNSGDTVAISASANSGLGYSFSGWSGSGTGSYTGPGNPVNIIMGGAITESGSFTQLPVHVTVQTTPAGDSIIVDGVKYISSQLFTWTSGSSHTIGLDSIQVINSGTRHVWNNWSDAKARSHTIVPLSDTTYTANLATQYYLTMIAGTGGTVSPSSGWYNSGQVVGISATSSSGYSFSSWTGTGTGSYSGVINPSSVTMSGAISESASFTQLPIQVTVQTNPVGRSFSVDDTLYTSAKTFVWMPGTSHTILTSSPQAGVSGTQYVWSSWSDGGLISHVVAPTRDSTYTANFTTQYYLTMNSNPGGSVTPTSNWYNSGQVVTITGIASSGYSFDHWTGTGPGSYSGYNNPATVTMNGPINQIVNFSPNPVQVTVQTVPSGRLFRVTGTTYQTTQTFTFVPGPPRNIAITTNPQNGGNGIQYVWTRWSDSGSINHDVYPVSDTVFTAYFATQYSLTANVDTVGNGITSPSGVTFYNIGDTVLLSATPKAGYTFTGWSGDIVKNINPVVVIMNAPITVTAHFAPSVQVTFKTVPLGRTVNVDGSEYIDSLKFTWLKGSSHTIAVSDTQYGAIHTRYLWTSWSDLDSASHLVTPQTDTTFVANFITQYKLTMSSDTGGYITPTTGWYDIGQNVTITATPKNGYGFIEWIGNGPSAYSGPSNQVVLTMSNWADEFASFGLLLSPPILDGTNGVSNGSSGQPTNPILAWHSYSQNALYTFELSRDSLFSTLELFKTTVDTAVQLQGLANQRTYYWRVKAKISKDSVTNYSQVWKFSTKSATITIKQPTRNWATKYTFPINWSSVDLTGLVNIKLSLNGGLSYSIISNNVPNSGFYSWAVPDASQWISNNCKILVESSLNPVINDTSISFATVSGLLPSTVTMSTSEPDYPSDPISSTSYRLISLPGMVDTLRVQTIASGTQKIDWKMFADNGKSDNYLVEYSSTSLFKTGEGYWFLKKNRLNIPPTQFRLPVLYSDATFSISLHHGWNIIANPFDEAVRWQSVLDANSLPSSTKLYAYSGSFVDSTRLWPFEGYYFFNDTSQTHLTSLKMPYPFGSMIQSVNFLKNEITMDWKIQLSFESDINKDPENYVGVSGMAKIGFDKLENHKPPLFLDQGFLYFSRPSWDAEYSRFNSDYRPAIGDGQVWEFETSNPRKFTGTIHFNGIEQVPSEYQVILINQYNSNPIDLRSKNVYSYETVSEKMPFKLLIGTKAFVQKEISKTIPESYQLAQNFPNPFNASTSISFKVPREAQVRIDIYSVLGQLVKTIIDGKYTPGVYSAIWDGNDQFGLSVASGVYFYRMLDGSNFISAQKMILSK